MAQDLDFRRFTSGSPNAILLIVPKKLIILFLLFAIGVFAPLNVKSSNLEACKFNDISEKFGPVRHQGNTQFCYAFSAADLLTEALDIKAPEQVSAYQIASGYINLSRKQLSQAKSAIAVEVANPQPNWRYEFGNLFLGVPSQQRQRGYSAVAMSQALNEGKVCLEREVPSQGTFPDDTFLFKMIDRAVKNPQPEILCTSSKSSVVWNISSIESLAEAIHDDEAYRVKRQTDDLCKNPMAPPKLRVHRKTYVRGHYYNGELIEAFSPESQIETDLVSLICRNRPISIDFDGCVAWKCSEGVVTAHVSTVVGVRTRENGDVEFKVRDSYGDKCKILRPELKCEHGSYWLNAKSLSKSTTSINWIEK